ncbi:AraC-like DNA-binding protein [Herbihabitans rhizosphaerae]|uniref:AraC-like DNA-binding protein n=1 Tax=Herbihabitans rhizosphaerae TaxID=1872711 RepID=A0A4Q7KW78_9PSEU|nr:AraC family transcriptional regulator [Herbihabitans rhizosphaerae]RZS41318.1 AraC-like DNA-binding protein [Herbihabitans rhizosphaerae]
MDVLAGLLSDVRSDSALLARTILEPPWSVRFESLPSLSLLTMVRGEGWIVPDGGEPVHLPTGAVAIAVSLPSCTAASSPEEAGPPRYVMHGSHDCYTADGRELGDELALGVRTCGDSLNASTVLITAGYQVRGRVSDRLLRALPPLLVVPPEGEHSPIVELMTTELSREEPGQQAILDRLLDLVLLTGLRQWLTREDACPPKWYLAMSDPVVGRTLRLLHDEPARRWTVESLAEEAGVSRATFARRFTDLVGEPPMSYLTNWRLSVAADLLQRTDATVESVARQVGYTSAFGLSVAFKRVHGTRPSELRS